MLKELIFKLHIIDIMEEYKDIVLNPKHGYGANLNPCLDCKIFMVKKAFEWLQKKDFDFIITGEVKGQRPMSQRKETLPKIAKSSGAGDLLLRPLCAKNLPETRPEIEGWVDRNQLFNITGRSRKIQIALAKKYGFTDYAQPAGGCCFLTNKDYSIKLQDLWTARDKREYDFDDIMLLKIGRHIRPKKHFKLIIARDEGEVKFLQGYRKQFAYMDTESHPGPIALIDGCPSDNEIELAARILARYGQGREENEVDIAFVETLGEKRLIRVKPLTSDEIPQSWIL